MRPSVELSLAPHGNEVRPSCPQRNSANRQSSANWVVSNETKPQSLSNVKPGDVLVSHPTAVREHEISIIPNAPHAISPTHNAAVGDGRSEADARGTDAWLTEDQTHVVKIASNRAPHK